MIVPVQNIRVNLRLPVPVYYLERIDLKGIASQPDPFFVVSTPSPSPRYGTLARNASAEEGVNVAVATEVARDSNAFSADVHTAGPVRCRARRFIWFKFLWRDAAYCVFPLTMLHLYMFKPPQRCLLPLHTAALPYFEFSRRALQLSRLTESRASLLDSPTGVKVLPRSKQRSAPVIFLVCACLVFGLMFPVDICFCFLRITGCTGRALDINGSR